MKYRCQFPGHAMLLSAAAMVLLCATTSQAIDGKRVNAYVVTAQWRTGMINWGPACPDCWSGWAGNIELVTVRNGSVTAVDTIWKRSQGLGQYPAFDAEANRVAFYRWSKATVGTTSTTVNGGVNTVAVMNRDGSNVRNLATLRAAPYSEMALNWPAGDWVYYINPKIGSSSDARQSNEIRRVNVNTLADELVWQQSGATLWFRRFETTMDGTNAGFQTYGGTNGDWNGVYTFPGMSQRTHFAGCNASVSASGTYGSSYFAGNHTEISFSRVQGGGLNLWLPLYDKTVQDPNWNTLYPNRGNINAWMSSSEPVFNGSVLNASMSAQCMRWAANSDKWVLQMVNHYGLGNDESNGSNCVAANWVDNAAFWVSHNVKKPLDPVQVGTLFGGNSAGDMWVDGGPGTLGKWEDTTGVWHAVPGYQPVGVSRQSPQLADGVALTVSRAGSTIRLAVPANRTFSARVIDARGRTAMQRHGSGSTSLRIDRLCPGLYRVVVSSGPDVSSSVLTIAQ